MIHAFKYKTSHTVRIVGIWMDEHILQIGQCARSHMLVRGTTLIIRPTLHNLETFAIATCIFHQRGPFRSTTFFGRDMTLRRNLGRYAGVVKLEIGRKSCCFFGQWHCSCWGFPLVNCFRMFLLDVKPLVFRSLSVPSWKENWHILEQDEFNNTSPRQASGYCYISPFTGCLLPNPFFCIPHL